MTQKSKIKNPLDEIHKFFHHEMPEILFHYTTLDGLYGILDKKEVWLSNMYFLNDKNEFELGLQLIRQEIEFQKIGLEIVDSVRHFLSAMEKAVNFIKDNDSPYILSLTKNSDLLSQWRAYTINGVGVNIGFSKDFFSDNSFNVFPCIYATEKQKDFVRQIVWDSILMFVAQADGLGLMGKNEGNIDPDSYDVPITIAGNFFMYYAVIACSLIKDSTFKEEEEWRLLFMNKANKIFFLSNKNYLKPYIKISIPNIKKAIKTLTIGPNPDMDLCQLSISKLLKSSNLSIIKTIKSNIPYRN
jgi:hypothetical protein